MNIIRYSQYIPYRYSNSIFPLSVFHKQNADRSSPTHSEPIRKELNQESEKRAQRTEIRFSSEAPVCTWEKQPTGGNLSSFRSQPDTAIYRRIAQLLLFSSTEKWLL